MQPCTTESRISSAGTETHVVPNSPPICFLSADAFCCEFHDGAIILDLRSDTYLAVDVQHLSNLRTRVGNWPDSGRGDQELLCREVSASDGVIADLLSRGILTTSPTFRSACSATDPTAALAIPSPSWRHITPAYAAQFFVAYLTVVLRLKRGGVASLTDWLCRHQSSIHRGYSVTREEIVERLASFLWLRPWCYTAQRRCLFDSLVLSVYLTRGMVPCTFAIGVATKPFLAHSWVQIGESVLNDTAEHVQGFRPILRIGGEH
jgi:Transglutaminase-like superfamily